MNVKENNKNTVTRSLADLKAMVHELQLPGRKGPQLAYALNSFARIVRLDLSAIPEDLAMVRQLMRQARPGRRLSKGGWGNVKSKVLECFRLNGQALLTGRSDAVCPPSMRALLDRIPLKPHRLRMSVLNRWLIENKLTHWDLDQATSERFRLDLEKGYGRGNPHKAYRLALRMFNRCRKEFTFWPQTHIVPHDLRDWFRFPDSAFAPEFCAEVDAMLTAATKGASKRRSGPKPMREETAKKRSKIIYRIASALALQRAVDPRTIGSLATLAQPDALDDALDFLVKRGAMQQSAYQEQVSRTILWIARRHLKQADVQLEPLRNIRKSVEPPRAPSETNVDLQRCFRDEGLQQDLAMLPSDMLKRLRNKRTITLSDALTAQMALGVAVLCSAPMRSINLALLEEGVHVFDTGVGRKREIRIKLPADTTKNEVAMQYVLSPAAIEAFDIDKKHFRETVAGEGSKLLFPSSRGGTKRPANLSKQIANFTRRELQNRITAHQFRHLIGYIHLCRHPGDYESVRRLLGHKRLETTMEYYAFMTLEAAQLRNDATFESLRHGGQMRRRFNARRKAA
jgi:site-specific recombinase XerC